MDMCFFRPKFALINQVSFPPGNKMRYDMLKEHGNTNMFLHDFDGFFTYINKICSKMEFSENSIVLSKLKGKNLNFPANPLTSKADKTSYKKGSV